MAGDNERLDGQQSDAERVIADAMEDARDGPLDPERLKQVRRLLETSADARKCYLQYNDLTHWLATEAILLSAHRKPAAPRVRWVAPPVVLVAAAAVVAIVAAAILLYSRSQPDEMPRSIAVLEHSSGNVVITNAEAQTRAGETGAIINSGDTIRTPGALCSVLLLFPDQTRLSLAGDTSLTVAEDGRKSVVFHGGTMFGSVVPQPPGRPMLVAAPQDNLLVLGTRFSLDASKVETDVSVSEGRVRLTRLHDGKSVEIPAGRRVVSNAASTLVVEAIPATPDQWSEDFENGLPEDWGIGRFVAADLPAGSKGAVRATPNPAGGGDAASIATQQQWSHSLFAVHDDTHLHFTFKMQDPGWFNILVLTRTSDGDPPTFAGNYIFDRQIWFGRPGDWGAASIPLAEFRPLPPSRDAFENATPFQVLFSSPDKDRGLVIDRMWVSREGSGTVEVEELP